MLLLMVDKESRKKKKRNHKKAIQALALDFVCFPLCQVQEGDDGLGELHLAWRAAGMACSVSRMELGTCIGL